MEPVYTQLADEIFTVHNMLTDAECEVSVSLGESIGFPRAKEPIWSLSNGRSHHEKGGQGKWPIIRFPRNQVSDKSVFMSEFWPGGMFTQSPQTLIVNEEATHPRLDGPLTAASTFENASWTKP